MIFKPAWALNASTSALLWRMISSIGRSNWKFTGLTLNLALASASGLMSCSFMRLLVLVCFSFHRRACLLGSQTTNRFSTIQGTFPAKARARTNANQNHIYKMTLASELVKVNLGYVMAKIDDWESTKATTSL